ncbi:unnamed protein product [Prorocentrum cordatum]|uniref:Uncharacterized protein n=1 Tax=Prorocentrum cordatum TaxID=2364126 RepID=A0ABN9Y432_9DINO|nr:unnamed protein product [Polarella glacialis]
MPGGVSAASLGGRVLSAIVSHLREIEGLITSISTFFRCVDIAGDAAGPSESGHSQHAAAPPPPPVFRGRGGGEGSAALRGEADEQILAVDHSRLGYLVPVDCGHNGYLDETESRHLSLHIRTAEFGRAARQDPMGPVATAYGAPRHA